MEINPAILKITSLNRPVQKGDPLFSAPHCELVEIEGDIAHWQLYQHDIQAEVRIAFDAMGNIVDQIEGMAKNEIIEVRGLDESGQIQIFFLKKTNDLVENLKAEFFTRLEIYRLSKGAEKAAQEGTPEYEESIGKFWEALQELGNR